MLVHRTTVVALLVSAVTRVTSAEEPGLPEAAEQKQDETKGPRSIEFRAGRVVADQEQQIIDASRGVELRFGRYRLRGEQFRMTRTPHGVHVDGEGTVSFCQCEAPPVSFGFSSVTAAPPSDLFLEDPTLALAGVPVLWLPYLWLRSPARAGLLPPKVAWRGDDGLLLGAGAHLPLDRRGAARVDIAPALYTQGGVEVSARVATPLTTTHLRWDHLRSDLLELESRGFAGMSRAALAWELEALRGPRARTGTLSLERAARPYDRAAFRIGHSGGAFSTALSSSIDAPRGAPLDGAVRGGPRAGVSVATPLSNFGTSWASVDLETRHLPGHAETQFREYYAVEVASRPGPLAFRAGVEEDVRVVERANSATYASGVSTSISLSLPLVRTFADEWTHWVEPHVHTSVRGIHARGSGSSWFQTSGAGVRSALGAAEFREGGEIDVSGGLLSSSALSAEPAGITRVHFDLDGMGLAGEGLWLPRMDQGLLRARARFGAATGLHVLGSVDGQAGDGLAEARQLGYAPAPLHREWFDRPGWSTGGELRVPWTAWLASSAGADYDVTEARLLAVFGTLAYHHPCACLGAVLSSGSRVGRGGVDVWMTVDVSP